VLKKADWSECGDNTIVNPWMNGTFLLKANFVTMNETLEEKISTSEIRWLYSNLQM